MVAIVVVGVVLVDTVALSPVKIAGKTQARKAFFKQQLGRATQLPSEREEQEGLVRQMAQPEATRYFQQLHQQEEVEARLKEVRLQVVAAAVVELVSRHQMLVEPEQRVRAKMAGLDTITEQIAPVVVVVAHLLLVCLRLQPRRTEVLGLPHQ